MTDRDKERKSWPEEQSDFKSPWVWGIGVLFLLFMFVEVYMVTTAVIHKPDLVTKDYYKRGQSFTERSKLKSDNIKKLGWEISLAVDEITVNQPTVLVLSITSNINATVEADEVTLFSYRPSDEEKDFQKQMNKTTEGRYAVELTFEEPGYWDLIVVAKHDDKEADLARRIYVKSD